ncbi:MAG: hypothetical protein CFH28_00691, partial [Alphaproteobacteria bacterium MarineAlpha6_Bin6]
LVNFNVPRRCNMAEELSFYDVKTKKKFNTSDYRIEDKAGRKFAVTKSQEGSHECWRVVSKDFAAANGG